MIPKKFKLFVLVQGLAMTFTLSSWATEDFTMTIKATDGCDSNHQHKIEQKLDRQAYESCEAGARRTSDYYVHHHLVTYDICEWEISATYQCVPLW